MRRATLPSRRAAALLAAGALAAACSGPPVYAPDSADVVAATRVSGTTVSMTLASGASADVDIRAFLLGPGVDGGWLLLRGSSPGPWAYAVGPSNQAFTEPGCFSVIGVVSDARDRAEVLLGLGGGRRIVLLLPKAAGFVNHYLPSLGSTASGNLACLDAHGEVTSTWQ